MNADGGDLGVLASPVLGSGLGVALLETLVVGGLLDGAPPTVPALADVAVRQLARAGRYIQRDGQPLMDPGAALAAASEAVSVLLETRASVWRQLGIVSV